MTDKTNTVFTPSDLNEASWRKWDFRLMSPYGIVKVYGVKWDYDKDGHTILTSAECCPEKYTYKNRNEEEDIFYTAGIGWETRDEYRARTEAKAS